MKQVRPKLRPDGSPPSSDAKRCVPTQPPPKGGVGGTHFLGPRDTAAALIVCRQCGGTRVDINSWLNASAEVVCYDCNTRGELSGFSLGRTRVTQMQAQEATQDAPKTGASRKDDLGRTLGRTSQVRPDLGRTGTHYARNGDECMTMADPQIPQEVRR